jgi:NifB/MoaA-like Fe-S oxidoreductase
VGNGVGMTAKFLMEINESLHSTKSDGKFLVISGVSASDILTEQTKKIQESVSGVDIKVLPIKNEFFGDTVTCTGLLTATDILKGIESEKSFDYLVLPDVCLKQDEDVFLDDITLKEFQKRVNKPVIVTNGSGQSFVDAFTLGENIRIIK